MKYFSIIILTAAAIFQACSAAAPVAVQNTNTPVRDDRAQNTIAHGPAEQSAPPSNSNPNSPGKWTQGGDPIDTSKFDKAIADADKTHKAKPTEETAKKALAQAYYDRGFALTEARQYASALGDYRRALKLDPDNVEAKKWELQIISIYQMLKKEAPNEGEEPPPLKK